MEGGYTRIPVYDATPDNVIGLVYIKDVLRLLERRQPVVLRKILHPVHFVPETKKVGDLLKELQKRRTHMALVIDEHGSLVGPGDPRGPAGGDRRRDPGRVRLGGAADRDACATARWWWTARSPRPTCARATRCPIPESAEFETVAGFILESLGHRARGAASSWTSAATA